MKIVKKTRENEYKLFINKIYALNSDICNGTDNVEIVGCAYDSKNDECIYIGKFLNAISTLNKDGALRLIYQNKDFEIKYIDPGLNNKYIYGIFKLKHLVL
jgi:hypothetical protein